MPAADLGAADVDDGVQRVELAVGIFERFLDAGDAVDDIERFDQGHVDFGGVADEPHDGGAFAFAPVDVEPHALEPVGQIGQLFLIRIFFEYDDHGDSPS